ncbi:G-patch domain and KOW motifs-containing protein isoform X2 [Monomorium pharaonis]|uniref:G-patch domain and KOW motifs-containing protein isoform X2 n=1 Tax=Monomorium pharaonis TaxID=307658 RepID=UPI001747B6C4|nr:G-patch domain and KOW motifs-containing protein isoform X2 [Monomorium pharaonis]
MKSKEEKTEEPLVIPLLRSNTWYDRIINRIDASKSEISNDSIQNTKPKEESYIVSNSVLTPIYQIGSLSNIQIRTESPVENKTLTLDEQTAEKIVVKQIVDDLNFSEKKKDKSCNIIIPLVKEQDLKDVKESTLENYEKVPPNTFSSAMLRDMEWKPSSPSNVQINMESLTENKTLTLDEQAAKEIIEDLNSSEKKDESYNITVSLVKGEDLKNEESTLEDYEKVPVNIFGSAMLRGMGWKPGEGIGKNPKLAKPVVPELRPSGMGLGADKVAVQKLSGKTQKKEEEELVMQIGSFIKIIAGKQANAYGQIEGFNDAGRLIVKMALSGNNIFVNESIVEVVTKAEYSKNSKVLNAAKYEEHKKKEDYKRRSVSLENSSSDNSDLDVPERKRRHKENDYTHKSKKSSKKSKSQQRDSFDNASDSDSDNKRRHRSRKRSSSSDRSKRMKKSKKHKGRNKECERRKDKTSIESFDRRKYKKHRSRSSSRR